jgi:AcrR family transcriptional regulator
MRNREFDRRTSRTKASIQKAHLELILKKGYEAMSVQDICDAANVGRSTFYSHFTGKDDLRRNSFEHLRKLLSDRQTAARDKAGAGSDQHLAFSLALFEHAREYLNVYRALLGSRGGAIGLGTIRRILCDLVDAELKRTATGNSTEIPRELVVQYVVGGCMAMLTWWLDRGAKLSPDRMDAMFRSMVSQGIRSLAT